MANFVEFPDNAGFLGCKVNISFRTEKLQYPQLFGTKVGASYKKRRHRVSLAAVELYHEVNVRMAKVVQDYFKLDTPLYPDYIHLVCRSPTDDITQDAEDAVF